MNLRPTTNHADGFRAIAMTGCQSHTVLASCFPTRCRPLIPEPDLRSAAILEGLFTLILQPQSGFEH